jgi:Lrp/AsnC family transcriptional regulator, leucine-responsive regulatory protein
MSGSNLDHRDRRLLTELSRNSARSNEELAESVGLSQSQCYRRRQNLEQSRVILGYRAELDLRALGLAVGALVHIHMESQSAKDLQDFNRFINRNPNVRFCYAVTGDSDYVIHVVTRDLAELNQFIHSLLSNGNNRYRASSQVILDTVKEGGVVAF